MHNGFGGELRSMVDRVRAVYSGRLTYDMHINALLAGDLLGIGAGGGHLWEDLDLDIVGVSSWPALAEPAPTAVMSVRELEALPGFQLPEAVSDGIAGLATLDDLARAMPALLVATQSRQ